MSHHFSFSRFRVCWLLLAILTLGSTRSYAAYGDKFTYDGIQYEVISETDLACSTVGYQNVSGDIVLPSTIPYGNKNYTLYRLGEYTFNECQSLTSVTIPNTVLTISNYAFSGCSSLASVNIPNSVVNIGDFAFSGCSSLTSVTIPNSVTYIGQSAFGLCSSLTSVTIPDSVTEINGFTFYDCRSLTSVTIPNSVTEIGESAFCGCHSLSSITIPNSVTLIAHNAFQECSSLTSITIPNSVTSLGGGIFYSCSSLKAILVEQGNQYYSSDGVAIYNADKTVLIAVPAAATSFTIPDSVIGTWSGSFHSCSSLTSLVIPESVKRVGDFAFVDCSLYPLKFMGATSLGIYRDNLMGLKGWIACPSEQIEYIRAFTNLPIAAWDEKYVFTEVKPLSGGIKISVKHNSEYGSTESDNDLCIVVSDVNGNEVKRIPAAVDQEIIISGLDVKTQYTLALTWRDANGQIETASDMSFTTESLSGIYDIEYVKPEVKVVGYYDITGRRYDEPIRGINIVVYSDGSTKKVVYSNR